MYSRECKVQQNSGPLPPDYLFLPKEAPYQKEKRKKVIRQFLRNQVFAETLRKSI